MPPGLSWKQQICAVRTCALLASELRAHGELLWWVCISQARFHTAGGVIEAAAQMVSKHMCGAARCPVARMDIALVAQNALFDLTAAWFCIEVPLAGQGEVTAPQTEARGICNRGVRMDALGGKLCQEALGSLCASGASAVRGSPEPVCFF